MVTSIPVVLCLRNKLIRDGIALILKSAKYQVQASVANSEELNACGFQPDLKFVLMLDDQMNGNIDPDAIAQMKLSHPQSSIVVLLDSYPEERRWELERLGLAGVLLKSISSEVFVASMKLVMLGERVFSVPVSLGSRETATVLVERLEKATSQVILLPEQNGEHVERRPDGSFLIRTASGQSKLARRSELSERELHILACLVAGNSNKVIARACGITEATVKVHLKAILRKTEVVNRTQAAVWAMNNVARNGAALPKRADQIGHYESAHEARPVRAPDEDNWAAG